MKIVAYLMDEHGRSLVVGPFDDRENARRWAEENTERTEPLPALNWHITSIASPEEWEASFG